MSKVFSGKVRDISSQGLGVVDHPEGRSFFVRGAWPGDEGDFEIESIEKKYGFAKISKLTKLSEAREKNPCIHSGLEPGQCGGCAWLGIRYSDQLIQKQKMVNYLLSRSQAAEEGVTTELPILPSPRELGYRNRAQFKTNGIQIGFVSPGTKVLAPIQNCLVLTEKNQETLQKLRSQLPNKLWAPEGRYLWNFLEIDEEVTAETLQQNTRRTFKQANDAQNLNMQNWLRDKLAKEDKSQTVLELFCGSGNFTKVISDLGFEKIIAAEADQRAIDELGRRSYKNVTGHTSNLFFPTGWKDLIVEAQDATILVLDPPREGFKALLEFVGHFPNLEKIFYISCEVSRFANEVRDLKTDGWHLKQVQPVDQFPHTPHVEILGEIVKTL